MSGQRPGPPQQKKNPHLAGCGWTLGIVFFIAVAVIWSMYDEGVFDRDSSSSASDQVFGPRDSDRLLDRLTAASKAQGVCYGWEIDSGKFFTLPSPGPSTPTSGVTVQPPRPGVETGSNLGLGTDPRRQPQQCPKWVVFTADYSYSSIDEEWTSVRREIETNLPIRLSQSDFDEVGISEKDLLGDSANSRLADSIAALPMLVAERGGAPPLTETAGQAPPTGDKISEPSKNRYIFMGIAGILVIGGVVWISIAAVRSRRSS